MAASMRAGVGMLAAPRRSSRRASDRIQQAGHQNVVDVPPAEEEFLTQDSLDGEAARLIQPTGRDIATNNTQRQLACAPSAGAWAYRVQRVLPLPHMIVKQPVGARLCPAGLRR